MDKYEKLYNEALERARALWREAIEKEYPNDYLKDYETIFPELAESEDERIRRTLVEYFGPKVQLDFVRGVPIQKIRDWLEKQKEQNEDVPLQPIIYTEQGEVLAEQKPAEWSEEDEKMLKCCLIAINHYEKTCNIGDHLPTKFNIDGYLASVDKVKSWLKSLRPQPKQKPAEKQDYSGLNDLERAILRGFLCAGVENVPVEIIKDTASECIGFLALIEPDAWSEEDKKMLLSIVNAFRNGTVSTIGQEQWLKSLPERFNLQPKQEWSEEDEKMLTGIIERGSVQVPPYTTALREEQIEWLMNRLKSLRPDTFQNGNSRPKTSDNWKPAQEQMKALQHAIDACESEWAYQDDELRSLLNDLKKL